MEKYNILVIGVFGIGADVAATVLGYIRNIVRKCCGRSDIRCERSLRSWGEDYVVVQ